MEGLGDLQKTLGKFLKDTSGGIGNIKQQAEKIVNDGIGKVDDKEKKEYLRSLSNGVLKGSVSAEDIIKEIKKL